MASMPSTPLYMTLGGDKALRIVVDAYDRSTWPSVLQCVDSLSKPFNGPLKTQVANHERPALVHPLPCPFLSLRNYIFSGRTMAGFAAVCGGTPVVVKFAFPEADDFVQKEILSEVSLYHDALRDLQGSVVPKWYGMFISRQPRSHVQDPTTAKDVGVFCSVLEDVGERLTAQDIRLMSIDEKNAIVNKYRALHAAGVVHTSAKPKHWLRHGRMAIDTIRLIDFGTSIKRHDDPDDPVFDALAQAEIETVCQQLNLDTLDLAPWPSPQDLTEDTLATVTATGDSTVLGFKRSRMNGNDQAPPAKKRRT